MRKSASPLPDSYEDDGTPMDWHEDQQIRPTVGEWNASGQWQEDLQLTEYIESRVLMWIKKLEQMADLALQRHGDLP
jgi:hypothetical protein